MKKILIGGLIFILSAAVTISALAFGGQAPDVLPSEGGKALNQYLACADDCKYGNFIDADNDGICDNREERRDCWQNGSCQAGNFSDIDNDGICDNKEGKRECEQNGSCQANLTDADNNGICDNREERQDCWQNGSCQAGNFTDADNDGICDNCGHKQGGLQTRLRQESSDFIDDDNDGVCDNKENNCGNRSRQNRGSRGQNKRG